MEKPSGKKFSFRVHGVKPETFEVVSFTGKEGLSKLYQFDITLVSADININLQSVVGKRATLFIRLEDEEIPYHGIVRNFDMKASVHKAAGYKALLVPGISRSDITRHNRVMLNKNPAQIIEEALKNCGLTTLDYELRLSGKYYEREYICQYGESDFNFLARWMEREGIYFFFEQGREQEKIIIADNMFAHTGLIHGDKLKYLPVSGLDDAMREKSVKSLRCSQQILPKKVVLKDFNYRNPSLDLLVEAPVDENGTGEVFLYGEHIMPPEEGKDLARLRAEEIRCKASLFHGESLAPYLRSGFTFRMEGHYREDFNRGYLLTEIEHEGSQPVFSVSGTDIHSSDSEKEPFYRNIFTAIKADVQYRPERKTVRPLFSGTVHAIIDAEGDGNNLEIDELGRYKVRLPFDLSGTPGGKASSWVRKLQPYIGSDHGMHFPMRKGTEVLLTFIDGNPDRPCIAGAVANPAHPNVVSGRNSLINSIVTAGGNRLLMSDKKGQEFVGLWSPFHKSMISLGSVEGPGKGSLNTYTAGNSNSFTIGQETSVTVGGSYAVTVANDVAVSLGCSTEYNAALSGTVNLFDSYEYTARGNSYTMHNGNYTYLGNENGLSGLESVTIASGGDFSIAAIMKSVNTALLVGLVGNFVGAAISTGVSFAEPGSSEEEDEKDWHWGAPMAAANLVSGMAFSMAAALLLKSAAKTYSKAKKDNTIELSDKGITIEAIKRAAVSAGDIKIEAGNEIIMNGEKSIQIAVPEYKHIPSSGIFIEEKELVMRSYNGNTENSSIEFKPTSLTINSVTPGVKSVFIASSDKMALEYSDGITPYGGLNIDKTGLNLIGPNQGSLMKWTKDSFLLEGWLTQMTFDKEKFGVKLDDSKIDLNKDQINFASGATKISLSAQGIQHTGDLIKLG